MIRTIGSASHAHRSGPPSCRPRDGPVRQTEITTFALKNSTNQTEQILPAAARMMAREVKFVTDSPLEEAGFEPSVPRQGAAFFTEGNELYPLPINHQAGDRASGEKRLSRGRRNRCQRLRSLH
jgi:hypothetical protein